MVTHESLMTEIEKDLIDIIEKVEKAIAIKGARYSSLMLTKLEEAKMWCEYRR